ncbi:MAG TPA: threonine/serine exporter family protein [Solirubrobacteraceae bacterium]|jgi:uncharacterized membrane protein YjjP (DUF1212 family)
MCAFSAGSEEDWDVVSGRLVTTSVQSRGPAAADAAEVQAFLLSLGVALAMTGDSVSQIQDRLRAIAAGYGHSDIHVSLGPTLLMVRVNEGHTLGSRTIDSTHQLRLDQASEVIRVARSAEAAEVPPAEAASRLERALRMKPRFGPSVTIASYALLTLGLGFVIGPASGDFWWYLLLGGLVGAMSVLSERFGTGGPLLGLVAAAMVSAIAFLAQSGNETASLRLAIPPLVTFLPGALLTIGTVDLAMGETIAGASRFVAGLLQLVLLAIAIVIGAEIVNNSHTGPIAGPAAQTAGTLTAWLGVAIFGIGIFVYNSAPKHSLPWLLVVLFSAWIGQLIGKQVIDPTLSGFVGAAIMVPVAHLVARARTAPPAHVMFLPAFWLLVPGTIGLIGVTEIVGRNSHVGAQNLAVAVASIPSVALGILVGTMIVRGGTIARHHRGSLDIRRQMLARGDPGDGRRRKR